MRRHIRCSGGVFEVGNVAYRLNESRHIRIISVGKAAVQMVAALLQALEPEILNTQILDGIVVGASKTERAGFRCFVGGHPLPNEQSKLAADAVLEYLSESRSDSLIFFLISGGASAMLEKPLDPMISQQDTALFHQMLVHSGLRIGEMNALRKHFSAVKGGRLAVAASQAQQCTLLISDVPTDALHVVGSGPTMPDPTTIVDCHAIFAEHRSALRFPDKVMRFFESKKLPETPKSDHPAFRHAAAFALLSSDDLCREARIAAEREGFHVEIDNTCDDWPYQDAAEYLLKRLEELRMRHDNICLLSAGEISVIVKGHGGVGGRNQHFVLECARRIAGSKHSITVLSAGTDGIDGNSNAAGGVVDETTVARAEALGLSPEAALLQFDSNRLLHALGDTLVTGASGNNVRDLRILLSRKVTQVTYA